MTKTLRAGLMAGASSLALGMLISATPAAAFDDVNWTWDATITENITKDIDIDANLDPAGLAMVQDLQVHIGDLDADSTVYGIYNNQPSTGGTGVGTLDVQWYYGLNGEIVENGGGFNSPEVLDALVDETTVPPEGNGTVTATIDLSDIEVEADDAYDALTELPEVVSTATAVANNTSINTEVMTQLHEGQFAFNTTGDDVSTLEAILLAGVDYQAGNTHQTAAGVLTLLALTGGIEASEINATSTVYDILNATVDSSATAVGNNLTVNLDPSTPDEDVLIADAVQFAMANLNASSNVSGVTLNNYANLGVLDRPIVNSVATAVGNNKSITVMVAPPADPVGPQ